MMEMAAEEMDDLLSNDLGFIRDPRDSLRTGEYSDDDITEDHIILLRTVKLLLAAGHVESDKLKVAVELARSLP